MDEAINGGAEAAVHSPDLIRILVVEDHPFVREGIVGLLNGQPDFLCCAHADSIAETSLAIAHHAPDLVLLDLNLKDGNALGLIGALRLNHPALRLMILSQLDEVLYAGKALQAGANGYLMKETATENLVLAIRVVMAGKTYMSDAMTARLASNTGKVGFAAHTDRQGNRFD